MANELLSQVKKVNDLLHAGEPGNVSLDEHTGYTGYKPQFVIDAMNEVFGIGAWGFDELSNEISNASSDKGLAIAQVKVWLAGSESRPTGWGQNRVTRGDIGDAHKGAQTDAIKKALSYFSVGTRAYQGLLVAGEKGKQNGHQQPQRPTQQSAQARPQQPQAPTPQAKSAPLVEIPRPAPSANDTQPATAQQKDAIRKMSSTLQQGVPEDIDVMTFGSAKACIAVLSEDLKNMRKAS